MSEKIVIPWYSPNDIETFIPVIEKRVPGISIQATQSLSDFIKEAWKNVVTSILIYPEKDAREGKLWNELRILMRKKPSIILYEANENCNNIVWNIPTAPNPINIIQNIRNRLPETFLTKLTYSEKDLLMV